MERKKLQERADKEWEGMSDSINLKVEDKDRKQVEDEKEFIVYGKISSTALLNKLATLGDADRSFDIHLEYGQERDGEEYVRLFTKHTRLETDQEVIARWRQEKLELVKVSDRMAHVYNTLSRANELADKAAFGGTLGAPTFKEWEELHQRIVKAQDFLFNNHVGAREEV